MPAGDVRFDLPFEVIAELFIELAIELGAAPEGSQPQRDDPQTAIHDSSDRNVVTGSRPDVRHAGTMAAMPATVASASAALAHVTASVGASWNNRRDAPRDNSDAQDEPRPEPCANQPRRFAQHHQHHALARRTERQPHADLRSTSHREIRDQAVEPDCRQRDREDAKGAGEPRHHSLTHEALIQLRRQIGHADPDARIERLDAPPDRVAEAHLVSSTVRTITLFHVLMTGACASGT